MENMNSLTVLIPYSKIDSAIYTGYIYHHHCHGLYVAYFINNNNNYNLIQRQDGRIIVGTCCKTSRKRRPSKGNHISWMPGFSKIQLFIEGNQIILTDSRVITYNLNELKESQSLAILPQIESLDYIPVLYRLIHESDSAVEYSKIPSTPHWMTYSMFLQHLFCYAHLMKWLAKGFKKNDKLQIRQANCVLTIMLDLFMGYMFLHLLSQFNVSYSSFFMGMLEQLVNTLHLLLKWLMGSPAGLKLNNAFNKMLGKYFSYHIQLWWIFLDVSGEKLDIVLNAYQYLGYMGLSFQAAMICDLICISIFHSYCIYVYAARLFNLQIRGLTALMRLFLGRKYNPLREGVDSCEYTNQELFVGTVAFTILLLLLPTTAMYYTVFTLLRLISLGVQHCLAKLIYVVQTLPIYQSMLWLLRSSKVKGKLVFNNVLDINRSTPRDSCGMLQVTSSWKLLISKKLLVSCLELIYNRSP